MTQHRTFIDFSRPTEVALRFVESPMATPSKPTPAADPAPAAVPERQVSLGRSITINVPAGATSMLDFILVVGALVLIGGGLYGLFTIKDTPKENLPIIASLLSFLAGSILGAYAGYRWGASDTMKKMAADAARA